MENKKYLTEQIITYIGNKRKLLQFIGKGIDICKNKLGKEKLIILDGFSGTGIVSRYLKQFSKKLYVNDMELYSYITNMCYLSNKSEVDMNRIKKVITFLNQKKCYSNSGIIEELYSPKDDNNIQKNERVFYTNKNAKIIDNIRKIIDIIPDKNKYMYIAPLLSKASIHNNTGGVFKGFYKNSKTKIGQFGGNGQNALQRIKKEIFLPIPVLSNYECNYKVFKEDINIMVKNIEPVDITYFDPPYNQHPYGSNYFMLNIISEYKKPKKISKVSGIPTNWKRSLYNKSIKAEIALSNLIRDTKSKYILLSYNNEGIIPKIKIEKILSKYGKIELIEKEYNTYKGSRNLKNRNLKVIEILYILEKHRG